MPVELLVQALLNGFALALGLTPIFSILEIINFAAQSGPSRAGLERLNWLVVTGYPWVLSQWDRDYETEGQTFEEVATLGGSFASLPDPIVRVC